ncbi:hypothetical protein UPYG_G00318110 [Umbra pygmaea]|uniref:G-protein coupled receptors family 1 profile domain-containing protein n=1 Tax=Umbra pygmaea TaxID=75934 RepID=A0ABD0WNB6_UMBPY
MSNMTGTNSSYMFSLEDWEDIYADLNYTDYNITFKIDEKTLTCNTYQISSVESWALFVFYILIFLLAIPGNLVVVWVISNSNKLLSSSNVYLLNLAVADILLALTLPFGAISSIFGWVFHDTMCKLVSIFQDLSFYTSIWFLTCISVDRYLVIVHAMEAPKTAHRRLVSWGICAAVWFMGSLLSLHGLFKQAMSHGGKEQPTCTYSYTPDTAMNWRMAMRLLRHMLGFLLPLAIMVVCYGVTIARLLRTRDGFQRQRAMRVIIAVVACFLLCWMPYHLAFMADTMLRTKMVTYRCKERTVVDRAMFVTQSIAMLHCCVNPLLYAFVGEKFRRRLVQMLHKSRLMEQRTSVTRASRSTSQTSEATSTFM